MYKLTHLITLKPEADRAAFAVFLNAAVQGSPQVTRALLRPTLPGVYNGGDFIWHLQFKNAAAYRAFLTKPHWKAARKLLKTKNVANVESAAYEGGKTGAKRKDLKNGVYRVLFLSVKKGTPEKTIRRFDTEMQAMPDYISSIQNWQLSRVAKATGKRKWTHVWEQEYADIGGLHGPYMMHPYHWGHIDRWFNPECADWIVDTYLCHTFCALETAVIPAR
ncbi:MAG: Dabb family protein [Rhodospirillaceae bacterium]|nr:Dabb family protein [Rhodospirillaceae bacterium]